MITDQIFRLAESERNRICNQVPRMQLVQICWRKSIPRKLPESVFGRIGYWAVNVDCMSQSGDMLYNKQRADHSLHVCSYSPEEQQVDP